MRGPDERRCTGMPNIDAFGEQLVQAAARQPTPRRRFKRILLPIVAVGLSVPVTIAIASQFDSSDEPRVVGPGETITVGFIDPTTDEPLRCPDGSLFTWTVEAGRGGAPDPECADGSVPELFEQYRKREQRFLEGLSAGEPMTDAPRLPTFDVQPGE